MSGADAAVDPVDPAEAALTRATWQPVLLAPTPRRLDLLRLRSGWPLRRVTARIHRNHAVEAVTAVWRPFCAYAGLDVVPVLGPYDDSLDLAGAEDPVDLHVVCLDLDRYADSMTGTDLVGWLAARVAELARRSGVPVLVTNWPSPHADAVNDELDRALRLVPGAGVADVASVARAVGPGFLDHGRSEEAGTPWSAQAAVAVARDLGMRWLPAVLGPAVKAVVVDLDGTLYDGVLGEDGPAALVVGERHRELQEHLLALRDQGVLLGVVSRNDPADVEELFGERTDLPLRWSDLSAAAIGWGSKAEGIQDVAEQLRIAPDAMAFLDDNPGELATVAAAHPGVRTLHAADPVSSLRALVHCPGLTRIGGTEDDALRVTDLAVARRRATELQRAADPDDYLRSLQVRLRLRADQAVDVPRVAQLTERTNQFTTALLRVGEAELTRRRAEGSLSWVAVSLRDRLADSGTVAAVLGRRSGRVLRVEGVSISCRALGRRVETALVEAAVALLAGPGVDQVVFDHATGPRNAPARDWLAGYAGVPLEAQGQVVVEWHPRHAPDGGPVAVEVEGSHDGV